MTDLDLLKQYGEKQSQRAFAELVRRHLDWVYGAAIRQVHDRQLAEDVAQGVFIALSRRAKALHREQALSPWLLRVVRCAAINALRGQRRRQRHEQKAAAMRPESTLSADSEAQWEEVAPLLDDQVLRLGKKDQEAILLRFYEQKSLAEVGEAMGLTEKAAQKRVERAVGKLRERLAGKGVEVEAEGLGAMVLAHAAGGGGGGAAGLVEKVMAGIGAGGAGNGTAGVIAKGALNMMTIAKVKVAALVVGAALVGAVGMAEIVTRSGERSSATAVPSKITSDPAGLATTQAVAVESPITAWKRGNANRAVDLLRTTDWSAPGAVPVGSTFEMSEAKFVRMPQAERDRLQPEVQEDARVLSALLRGAMAKGDEMAGKQDSSAAQSYYRGVDRCARYFAEDGRSLKIHQLIAIAAAKAVKLKLPQAKE